MFFLFSLENIFVFFFTARSSQLCKKNCLINRCTDDECLGCFKKCMVSPPCWKRKCQNECSGIVRRISSDLQTCTEQRCESMAEGEEDDYEDNIESEELTGSEVEDNNLDFLGYMVVKYASAEQGQQAQSPRFLKTPLDPICNFHPWLLHVYIPSSISLLILTWLWTERLKLPVLRSDITLNAGDLLYIVSSVLFSLSASSCLNSSAGDNQLSLRVSCRFIQPKLRLHL